MATKPETAEGAAPAPAKSNKMLFIVVGVVLALVLGGAGAFFMLSKKHASDDEEEGAAPPKEVKRATDSHATPPVYLAMDTMVVNLADPGGERVAQVGVSLVVDDAKTAEKVKAYLPSIRSGVLLLLSQRTADELLQAEGKDKLSEAILREASVPFGGSHDDEDEGASGKKKKRQKSHVVYPVTGVLFTNFIVQ